MPSFNLIVLSEQKTRVKTIFQILSATVRHVALGKGIYEGMPFFEITTRRRVASSEA